MFNIKDFLIKSIILSYEEGSMGEGQVGMTTMQYFLKGMLTEEDVNYINEKVADIKTERQRKKEEQERLEQERLEQEERDREEMEKWLKEEEERLEQERLEQEELEEEASNKEGESPIFEDEEPSEDVEPQSDEE